MTRQIVVPHYSHPDCHLRFDLDTGDSAELTGSDATPTLGFYGYVRKVLFGVHASPDGPQLFVRREQMPLADPAVRVDVVQEPGTAQLVVRRDGRLVLHVTHEYQSYQDFEDGRAFDEVTQQYLEWLLERFHDAVRFFADYTGPLELLPAATSDEALAWARRALENDRDQDAAIRATELDPEFPERSLIARTTGRVSTWPGLRELRRVTTIATRHARRYCSPIDLGWGVIAFEARSENDGYVAVDILGQRMLWTSRALRHHEDELWLDEANQVCRRDPLTGQITAVLGPRDTAPRFPCTFGGGRFAVEVTQHEGNLNYGNEDPTTFDVVFHDLERRTERLLLRHLGDRARANAAPDGAVLEIESELRFVDAAGQVRWAREYSGHVFESVDGRLIIYDRSKVEIVDAASGRTLALVEIAGSQVAAFRHADQLVLNTDNQMIALSWDKLVPRWSTPIERRVTLATADSLIVIGTDVTTYDPRKGKQLSSLPCNGQPETARLVAGKLVMLAFSGGPPVVVVE